MAPIPLDRQQLRDTLRHWSSTKKLGEQPLANLQVVDHKRLEAGYGETVAGRGLALREFLSDCLAEIRPEGEGPDFGSRRWRPYIILHERYKNGRSPAWIMEQLAIARRTFYNELDRGLDSLLDTISAREMLLRERQAETPPPATTYRPPFMPPPNPELKLVGRQATLQAVWELIERDGVNSIALHGLPGMGKTSIALTVAHDPRTQTLFPDGVLWIGLGTTPDLENWLSRVATAVGISSKEFAQCGTAVEQAQLIHQRIESRKMLIIIDDVWQLDNALLFRLGDSQSVHLITTRQPEIALDFAAQHLLSVSELSHREGLDLLKQLAPDAIRAEPMEATNLVQAVGGLPLALTLIGKHLRKAAYHHQTGRLQRTLADLRAAENRLHLSQPQTPITHHPSLAANLEISLDAVIGLSDANLPEQARSAFYALAQFPPKPNSYSEEAACFVAETSSQTLDLLVDRGILEVVGPARYTLHQSLVDYARANRAQPRAMERLVTYYVTLCEDDPRNFTRLEPEQTNIGATLAYAEKLAPTSWFMRGIKAHYPYLEDRGLFGEIEEYLSRGQYVADAYPEVTLAQTIMHFLQGCLAIRSDQNETALRYFEIAQQGAQATQNHALLIDIATQFGRLLMHLGEHERAIAVFEEGLNLARQENNQQGVALLHNSIGSVYYYQSQYDAALPHFDQARQIMVEREMQHDLRWLYLSLGLIMVETSRFREARSYYERSLELQRELGDYNGEARLLNNLGVVANNLGEWERAVELHRNAFRIRSLLNYTFGLLMSLNNLGITYIMQKNYEEAEQLLLGALETSRSHNYTLSMARMCSNLSWLCRSQERYGEAEAYARQSIEYAREFGNRTALGDGYFQLGAALSGQQRFAEAEEPLQTAVDIWRTHDQIDVLAETQAFIAYNFYQQGHLTQARESLTETINYLKTTSAGVEDPIILYAISIQILSATGETDLASKFHHQAHAYISTQAKQLTDLDARELYLTRVWPPNPLGKILQTQSVTKKG